MINRSYIIWMLGSALICSGLHLLTSKGLKKRGLLAALTLAFGTVLGAVCARLGYIIIQPDYAIGSGLTETLLSGDMGLTSFMGGAVGVVLGALIAGKCTGNQAGETLYAYAPIGALMAAMARFGEYFLGTICAGNYVDNEALQFFPLSVSNEWGEWYQAVFMISGTIYLGVFLASLLKFRAHRFMRTVFYLCLPQVFCESLRNQSLMWSQFIRAEQLLCMILVEVILIILGIGAKQEKRRFWPAIAGLLWAGVFVAVEFAAGGKIFVDMSPVIYYGVMVLGLVCLGWMEHWLITKQQS